MAPIVETSLANGRSAKCSRVRGAQGGALNTAIAAAQTYNVAYNVDNITSQIQVL